MTKHLCDACWFHHVGKKDFACLHIIPFKVHESRKKDTNEVPTWCPLKIKYRFNYHIVRNSHGIYPRNR